LLAIYNHGCGTGAGAKKNGAGTKKTVLEPDPKPEI